VNRRNRIESGKVQGERTKLTKSNGTHKEEGSSNKVNESEIAHSGSSRGTGLVPVLNALSKLEVGAIGSFRTTGHDKVSWTAGEQIKYSHTGYVPLSLTPMRMPFFNSRGNTYRQGC